MKKISIFSIMAVAGMMLTACGSKTQPASTTADTVATSEAPSQEEEHVPEANHIAVLKAENILLPSELKGSVEVVPEDDGTIPVDMDDHHFPKVSITFKLLKKVPTESMVSEYGQMWLVGKAQDEKGRNIDDLNPKDISSREWRTEDSDGEQFKNFLEGEVGETITLDFTGERNMDVFETDEEKMKAGIEKTTKAAEKFAQFKLSISN